eukprot:1415879-Pleurochrysis_carterae.AAC.1
MSSGRSSGPENRMRSRRDSKSREYADGAGLKFPGGIRFLAPEVQVVGGWEARRLRAVLVRRGSWRMVVSGR